MCGLKIEKGNAQFLTHFPSIQNEVKQVLENLAFAEPELLAEQLQVRTLHSIEIKTRVLEFDFIFGEITSNRVDL